MGLSIAYTIRAPAALKPVEVRALLGKWAGSVRRARWGRAGAVRVVDPDSSRFQYWMTRRLANGDYTGLAVPPREGFWCGIEIGAGCEPLIVGLCRYPGRVTLGGRVRGLRGGWWLVGFCKTQYAALHGTAHFADCHCRVIDILRTAPSSVQVEIEDEGGYWPNGDERRLLACLGENQRAVAACAGAVKDAVGEDGPPVRAPIFGHPEFERLEHEGRLALERKARRG